MDFLKKYGINIKNQDELLQALTHSSYANENNCLDYERLEYLGDAVLQLIISDYLYNNTTLDEGELSKVRSSYVCEQALAHYADSVGYIPYIRVGHGQEKDVNDTIIADIFEAILGVIFLELGMSTSKKYIYEVVIPHIKNKDKYFGDYKTLLQEYTQTSKKTLEYVLVSSSGPAHDKRFEIEVRVDGLNYGVGSGKSKKEAEQMAAKNAIKKIAR